MIKVILKKFFNNFILYIRDILSTIILLILYYVVFKKTLLVLSLGIFEIYSRIGNILYLKDFNRFKQYVNELEKLEYLIKKGENYQKFIKELDYIKKSDIYLIKHQYSKFNDIFYDGSEGNINIDYLETINEVNRFIQITIKQIWKSTSKNNMVIDIMKILPLILIIIIGIEANDIALYISFSLFILGSVITYLMNRELINE
jgi:hypothetical protein